MRYLIYNILIFTGIIFAQKLGKVVVDTNENKFVSKSIAGADLIFSESGIGIGGFYVNQISSEISLIGDLSISESKDNEKEYYDYYNQRTITYNKKNRILIAPLNIGVQYRLFNDALTPTVRPYICFAAGPSFVMVSSYDRDIFDSFSHTTSYTTLGGYIGLGSNFGSEASSIIGLNARYYFIHMYKHGIEGLYNKYRKDLGGFFIILTIGGII